MHRPTETPNRLAGASSPYLLQHAHNPVDWYPWGAEALDRAKREDRPIFLSIGYSSCHWCHVMERESFEDASTAAFMNARFVNIKVDREERPDLDELYMTAVQAMTGHGGWPMSVFLTPDLRPFYGGTYFPPDDRHGQPSFIRVLRSVAEAYQVRRQEVDAGAEQITAFVKDHTAPTGGSESPGAELVAETTAALVARLDTTHGGFGGAPKFPQPMNLGLLMRAHRRRPNQHLEHAIRLTLDKMAMGGMYDQLAGGFHRYSTDATWLVPHFEKMLYDNALLARSYLEAYQLFGDLYHLDVGRDILDYVLRDMTTSEGGFCSATDADSEGEEGKYFVWERAEVLAVLGAETGQLFADYYDVTDDGNWEGRSILRVQTPLADFAAARGADPAQLAERLRKARTALLAARAQRVPPLLDDKVLTSWNALMMGSFAFGYRVTRDHRYRVAATRNAELLQSALFDGERLLRTRRCGQSSLAAYLEDYACLADALIDLYEATFEGRYLDHARTLLAQMDAHFWDADRGGYYFTAADAEPLPARSKPVFDNAIPSGNSMAASALVRMARLTEERTLEERALAVLRYAAPHMQRAPGAFGTMLQVLDRVSGPGREVVIAAPPGDPLAEAMAEVLGRTFLPDVVIARADGRPDQPAVAGAVDPHEPARAQVCAGGSCQPPVTTPSELAALLENASGS